MPVQSNRACLSEDKRFAAGPLLKWLERLERTHTQAQTGALGAISGWSGDAWRFRPDLPGD